MGLKTKYATKEEAPEHVREFLVEKDGKWFLDLEDNDTLEALRKERTDHSTAKKQLSETNTKLTEAQRQLEQFMQLGSIEEIQKWREAIEKAKPEPQRVEELQELLRARTEELTKASKKLKELEPRYAELEQRDAEHARESDRNKAKEEIHNNVKELKGVNAEALEHSMFLEYVSGNLKRNEAGEIVSSKDGLQLSDFAENYAKAYKLSLPSISGKQDPPGAPAQGADALSKAKTDYETAKKNRDSHAMQEAQIRIMQLENPAQT